MAFHKPAAPGGDSINLDENLGALLLIYPKEIRPGVVTSFGPKDPLVADVIVLDGPHQGKVYTDSMIFAGVLIGQVKNFIGSSDPALGRLKHGTAKPGQKPPYMLDDFTDADAKIATDYLAGHPRGLNRPTGQSTEQAVNHSTGEITSTPGPAATPPTPGLDVGVFRTLVGLGQTDAQISAAMGITVDQAAALRNMPSP